MGCGEVVEDGPQPGFVVGQCLVVDPFASGGEGDGVVIGLADVQADARREPANPILTMLPCFTPNDIRLDITETFN